MMKKRLTLKNRAMHERGQSLMEMAVSFTMLMLLLAGAVDFGQLFFSYVAILDASQEGAVYAAIEPGSDGNIEGRVRSSSTSPVALATDSRVSVAITPAGVRCAGDEVTVTVTLQYTFTMPLIGTILPASTVPISASTTAVVLRDGAGC